MTAPSTETVTVQIHPDTILVDLARALATGGFSIKYEPRDGLVIVRAQ